MKLCRLILLIIQKEVERAVTLGCQIDEYTRLFGTKETWRKKQTQRQTKVFNENPPYLFIFYLKSKIFAQKWQGLKDLFWIFQCCTVGTIFTFSHIWMFGPNKLPLLAFGGSRSRRIRKCKTYHKCFDQMSVNFERIFSCFHLNQKTNKKCLPWR